MARRTVPLGDVTQAMGLILQHSVLTASGCWEWQRYCAPNGYGTVPVRGRQRLAHRVALTWSLGRDILPGLEVNHLCRNRSCVNPGHLEEATSQRNNQYAKEAQTHCKHGHPLEGDNVYREPRRGHRSCVTCRAAAEARRPSRRKAVAA